DQGVALAVVGQAGLVPVHAADGTDHGLVPAVDLLHRVGDLADRGLGARGGDGQVEQVAVAALGAAGERVQGGLDVGAVALGPQPVQLGDLLTVDLVVVDLEDVQRILG